MAYEKAPVAPTDVHADSLGENENSIYSTRKGTLLQALSMKSAPVPNRRAQRRHKSSAKSVIRQRMLGEEPPKLGSAAQISRTPAIDEGKELESMEVGLSNLELAPNSTMAGVNDLGEIEESSSHSGRRSLTTNSGSKTFFSIVGGVKSFFRKRKNSISKSASTDSLTSMDYPDQGAIETKPKTSTVYEGKLSAEVLQKHTAILGQEGPVLTPSSVLPGGARKEEKREQAWALGSTGGNTGAELRAFAHLEKTPVRRRFKDFLVSCTFHTQQGHYHENEDRLIAKIDVHKVESERKRPTHLFGVIDGHGGIGCCTFMEANCESIFTEFPSPANSPRKNAKDLRKFLLRALAASCMKLEYNFCRQALSTSDNSGACCLLAAVHDNYLAFTSIGDCELLLVSGGGMRIERLNHPHRSSGEKERKRLEAAGGYVINGRAMGILEPSRTVGDLDVKRLCPGAVIAEPEVGIIDLKEVLSRNEASAHLSQIVGSPQGWNIGMYCILATDGVFDVMDSYEASRIVSRALTTKISQKVAAEILCQHAKKLGSKDDITAIVIRFEESNVMTPRRRSHESEV